MFRDTTRCVGNLQSPLPRIVAHANSFGNRQHPQCRIGIQQLVDVAWGHERQLAACSHQRRRVGNHSAGSFTGEHPTAHHLIVRGQEPGVDRCSLAKARLHQRPGKRDAGSVRQRIGHHFVRSFDTLRTARPSSRRARHLASGHGHHDGIGRLVGHLHHQTSAVVGNDEYSLHHIAAGHCDFGLHHGCAVDALLANTRRGTRVVPLVAGRQPPAAAAATPTIGMHHAGRIHHGASRTVQPDANPLL